MIVCLKTRSKQLETSHVQLRLSERLPFQIVSDCMLSCNYAVRSYPDYFLLTLDVSGVLSTQCQRCLDVFESDYSNYTELAICRDEATAAKIMEDYECIVSNHHEIDLANIVTDELHLYASEKHAERVECNSKIQLSI